MPLRSGGNLIIRDAPGYAFARKADKAFRKLVGK
jgi:hypothetical protein